MTMNCPRCQDSELDERTRDGVVVDACPRCRGVWLDRGELEKLIARATSELEEYGAREPARRPEPRPPEYAPRAPEYAPRSHDREPPSSRRGAYGSAHGKPYRKKGLLESLGDIFD